MANSRHSDTADPSLFNSWSNDPSLLPSWSNYVWAAIGCITVLITLAKSILYTTSLHQYWLHLIPSAFLAYIAIDLVSGVYHWAIDNYGSPQTPVLGFHIEAFTEHHRTPFAIARFYLPTNLHYPAQVITFALLPFILVSRNPVTLCFFGVFFGFFLFSVQIHTWAHFPKSKLPAVVAALQDAGILLTRSHHSRHHVPPHNTNYCPISGVCNKFLDEWKVFLAVETIVFFLLRVRPRSWIQTKST